ncbi:hypothetical protein [Corallincola spongiicola]|uniref:Uncharacterized protein n=1 Tax=Corallincola spongiicola TaxID=2520508 RepID=A0ABY1WUV4_9GAMM|nr:hypothetical protein [Corallincola spongiicola]TAA48536.1 hypothetical protein EXY25_04765 [Corallincola spongiicola]
MGSTFAHQALFGEPVVETASEYRAAESLFFLLNVFAVLLSSRIQKVVKSATRGLSGNGYG